MTEAEIIKREICDIGRRIYENKFIAANDGNISVKVSDNEYYCTPTRVSKGYMTPDMIIKVDGECNVLDGKLKPSSEMKMHLKVYAERPDVKSVVHAHPPFATAFAVANKPLDRFILPEAVIFLGSVPVCKYGTPSTDEIPESLAPYIQEHDAFLLQNHGALTVGDSLMEAYFAMESLEYYAKLSFLTQLLGGGQEIDHDNLLKLLEVRKTMHAKGKHPGLKKLS